MKKNKSNAKSIILNGVALLFSALIMIFYACPHWTAKSSVSSVLQVDYNGFDTIKNLFDVNNNTSATMSGVMILIVFIVAALVCLLAIVNLLSALGVIKKMRILKGLNVILSGLLAVAGIVGVICLAVYFKDINGFGIESSNGWANIINMILAICTCIVVSVDFYTTKK